MRQPTCRYDVSLSEYRVRISLRTALSDGEQPQTHRFATPPSVTSVAPEGTEVRVDGRTLSISASDPATPITLTIEHDAIRTAIPGGFNCYRLAFETDAEGAEISVTADGAVVAAESRSRTPCRRWSTAEGITFRGVAPVGLGVTVGSESPPGRLVADGPYRLRCVDSAAGEDGDIGPPCVLLSVERYRDAFGETGPVTRLGGVVYLDRAATQPSDESQVYVHGERCVVRPPESDDGHLDSSTSGRYLVVDTDLARLLGLSDGMQVRVRPDGGRSALFTVAATVEQPDVTVRMTEAGRDRLDVDRKVFAASLSSLVADPFHARDDARRTGGVLERLEAAGDTVLACAPHGGQMEINTDAQARRFASQAVGTEPSVWTCEGWSDDGDAFERFHVRSSDIDSRSFPLLSRVADRGFEHVVSFHCHENEGIVVGGRAPMEVRKHVGKHVQRAVADAGIEIRYEGEYMGRRPENFVNWLSVDGESGIQLEQSPATVKNHWRAVADAVGDAFDGMLDQ